jgi:superfamily I DNA/RNA helicase
MTNKNIDEELLNYIPAENTNEKSNILYTQEQLDIFNSIQNDSENLLIQAFAGSGKSFSIMKSIDFIPKEKSIIFLAYNKHIQEELKTKLPEYVYCFTTYGLGLSSLKRKYKDIEFDEFKIDKIINKKKNNWKLEEELKNYNNEYKKYIDTIKKAVDLCRLSLAMDVKSVQYICDKYEFKYNETKDIKRILSVLESCMNDNKSYDYVDMVFKPAIDPKIWMFQYDFVFIDECQDINRCQQKILEKIIKKDRKTLKYTGRLIAIGDEKQSIYGFAGSDDNSFNWFKKFPNTKILPLSTSFRCAKNIILEAQKIVSGIKAMDNAPDGIVREGNVMEEAESGDFVLCRTTAPLVKLFFYYLLKHKKATIKGSDIGISLIDMIGEYKNIEKLIEYWNNEIDKYKNDLIHKGMLNYEENGGYMALYDKVSTLLFLTKMFSTIPDMKNGINKIFTEKIEGITLSTVHRCKGLESDRVFIIRPDLLPMKTSSAAQYAQEMNLFYIAITRARFELIYDKDYNDLN